MSGLHPAAIAAAAVLVAVAAAASRQDCPLKSGLAAILSGVGALGAVDLLAPFTGVGLAFNGFSWFCAAVLGIPGVTAMLLCNVIFGL